MSKSIIINEQQALACILQKPELLKDNTKNWFVDNISRCIFDSLVKLYSNSVSFTTSTIVSECAKTEKDITHQLIEDLKTKVTYNIDDYDYYCRRLREDYVKDDLQSRVLKVATSELIKKGELNIEALQQTIDDLEKAIDIVKQKDVRLQGFPELLEKYEQVLLDRGNTSNFMSTGNSYLDSYLAGGGIPKGQFITVFAAPGMGKTTVIRNMVNGNINKCVPVLDIPLEMGPILTLDKMVSLRTQIPLGDFYKIDGTQGVLPDYILEAFFQEKERLSRNKFYRLCDSASVSVKDLKVYIKDMKRDLHVDSVQVVIDLFTMLVEARGDNKASSLQDLCDEFFEILKEENSTGIAVVQSRRKENINVSNYEDCLKYAPKIEEIKGSQSFEERSRSIISVFRPKHIGIRMLGEDDPEVMLQDDVLILSILKQNLAPLASLNYLYQGDIGKIYKLEENKNE